MLRFTFFWVSVAADPVFTVWESPVYHLKLLSNENAALSNAIVVEEIKMNLLAKSCFAAGLIAMISNLIASSGEIDPKEIMEEDWFEEYT